MSLLLAIHAESAISWYSYSVVVVLMLKLNTSKYHIVPGNYEFQLYTRSSG